MSTTALVVVVVTCLMILSAMTGVIGGYFLFAGKFSSDGTIIDDLMNAVSDAIPINAEAPMQTTVSMSPSVAPAVAPAVVQKSIDPATAPTLAPPPPSDLSAPQKITRPSQGDLSLDDFFTDFSVDAVNMSGDIPQMPSDDAANWAEKSSGKRPQTEPVDDSQVLGEGTPEGAG